MQAEPECIPCIQRQIIKACRFSNVNNESIDLILRQVMSSLLSMSWNKTPPEIAHVAHSILRSHIGGDPYAEIKKKSNDEALKLYYEVRKIVEESKDPLKTAIKIAIGGNIIDFGAMVEFDIRETLKNAIKSDVDESVYRSFLQDLKNSKTILYFFDNAGEIVFDKLLIEILFEYGEYYISGVVKGGPIINDATEEDLNYVGLNKYIDTIYYLSNGEVGYERNSPEVGKWIANHDLTISKGQGNYEGLSEWAGIYYLLMVKCPVVAKSIGANVGDLIFFYK